MAREFANIEVDLGCVGNVWTDEVATANTAILQEAIEESGKANGKFQGLYIPGKSFAINDTLVAYNHAGAIWMYGNHGKTSYSSQHTSTTRGWSNPSGNLIGGGGSELVWMGEVAENKPMLFLPGYGNAIMGVQFRGWKSDDNGADPAYTEKVWAAIQISRDTQGWNTGKNETPYCSFVQCQRGYHFGYHGETHNHADNHYFGMNRFHSCHTCVYLNNQQSVGHVATAFYVEAHANDYTTVVHVGPAGGGKIHIHSLEMVVPGTIFYIESGGIDAGAYRCDGLFWDANGTLLGGAQNDTAEQYPRQSMMVDMIPGSTVAQVRINGHFSRPNAGAWAKNLIRLRGPRSTCKIDITGESVPYIDRKFYGVHKRVEIDPRTFDPGAGAKVFFDVADAVQGKNDQSITHGDFDRVHDSYIDYLPNQVDGPLVSSLVDQVASVDMAQATEGNRPKLALTGMQRHPSVFFKGTSGENVERGLFAVDDAGLGNVGDLEAIFAIQMVNASNSYSTIAGVWGSTTPVWHLSTHGADPKLRLLLGSGSDVFVFDHPGLMQLETPHLVGFQRRASDGYVVLWIDGTPLLYDTVDATSPTPQSIPTGNLDDGSLAEVFGIGANIDSAAITNAFKGHIAVGYVGTTLSDASEWEYKMREVAARRGLMMTPDFATFGGTEFSDYSLGS